MLGTPVMGGPDAAIKLVMMVSGSENTLSK